MRSRSYKFSAAITIAVFIGTIACPSVFLPFSTLSETISFSNYSHSVSGDQKEKPFQPIETTTLKGIDSKHVLFVGRITDSGHSTSIRCGEIKYSFAINTPNASSFAVLRYFNKYIFSDFHVLISKSFRFSTPSRAPPYQAQA